MRSPRRRALVLSDEAARHPFRMSLPPHVLAQVEPRPSRPRAGGWLQDCREFLMAYCAAFLAVTAFIL